MRTYGTHLVCIPHAVVVLACAGSVAFADLSSPTMAIYAPDSSVIPQYRLWDGSTWGSPLSMPTFAAEPCWIIARNCPERNETACAVYDEAAALHLSLFDGTSWTTPVRVCQKSGAGKKQRAFDMAYEASGDLIAVYFDRKDEGEDDDEDDGEESDDDSGGTKGYRYRVVSNGTISAEGVLSMPSNAKAKWIMAKNEPGTDRILFLACDKSKSLYASVWAGSSFATAATLTSNLHGSNVPCWTAEYEALSRQGLIVYTDGNSSTLKYRTLQETSVGSETTGPTIGTKKIKVLRSSSRSGTDGVMVLALDSNKDLYGVYWDGTAWGAPALIATSLKYSNRLCADVAFQPNGAAALAVFCAKDSGVIKHCVWNGTTWGSVLDGSNGGGKNQLAFLHPAQTGTSIFTLVEDDDDDLMAAPWNGVSLATHTDLSTSVGGEDKMAPFTVVTPAVAAGDETARRVVQWQESNPR